MDGKSRRGDRVTGRQGDALSPRLPFSPSSRPTLERWVIAVAMVVLITPTAHAQIVSELEPERPISVEDAHPLSYRALSGSADWAFNWRGAEGRNDYGPGFSLLYGAARALEVGAAVRYVTSPNRNAVRGVSSGDLLLHALYGIHVETGGWPALAVRVGVQFPTGLDSKGTDLRLGALATRSFDAFRLHANVIWTRLGATTGSERKDRIEGIAGVDFLTSPRRLTDSLALADVVIRSNPVHEGRRIVTIEAGERLRIGSRTLFFIGAGSDVAGESDRARFRLRAGLTAVY